MYTHSITPSGNCYGDCFNIGLPNCNPEIAGSPVWMLLKGNCNSSIFFPPVYSFPGPFVQSQLLMPCSVSAESQMTCLIEQIRPIREDLLVETRDGHEPPAWWFMPVCPLVQQVFHRCYTVLSLTSSGRCPIRSSAQKMWSREAGVVPLSGCPPEGVGLRTAEYLLDWRANRHDPPNWWFVLIFSGD